LEIPDGATIEWLNAPNSNQTNSSSLTDLCPGVYQASVTKDGCGFVHSYEIICCTIVEGEDAEESIPSIDIELIGLESSNTSSSNDGEIIVSVTGGSDDRVISWTSPPGLNTSATTLTNLAPGEYCILVDDGCDMKSACYTIYDCSSLNPTVQAGVTNTCQGVAYGSIGLSLTGVLQPLDITWSNGATTLFNSNLAGGTYCVTITESSGCDISITACFTVGFNEHLFSEYTSVPCGSQYTCNGQNSIWEEYTGSPRCQYEDCNIWTCRCPLPGTGGLTGPPPRDDGYSGFRPNFAKCQREGFCRDGQGWEFVSNGIQDRFYQLVLVGINEYLCREFVRCTVGGFVGFTGPFRADLWQCGVIGGGAPTVDCDLQVNEFALWAQENNFLEPDETFVLADELSGFMQMSEYTEQLEQLIEENDYIKFRPLREEEKVTEISCGGGSSLNNVVARQRSLNGKDDSKFLDSGVQIYPNPMKNRLNIGLDFYSGKSTYEILNILEQPIRSGNLIQGNNSIGTKFLDSGVYIVLIREGTEIIYSQKVIKN
jgi:hypothetical protein